MRSKRDADKRYWREIVTRDVETEHIFWDNTEDTDDSKLSNLQDTELNLRWWVNIWDDELTFEMMS